ncbi:MAG TPA: flagellar basal body-associated FliL family protein [Alphaproteobacteria bacterium]|nr:flagellar basal body-associated FliL family protein [Alphaproteobacteria bacterium]
MATEATADEASGSEDLPRRKLSGKKLVLFIILPLVLLLLVGGGAAYFLLSASPEEAHAEEGKEAPKEEKAAEAQGNPGAPAVFFDLPDMLVNLNAGPSKRVVIAKVSVSIELGAATDQPLVQAQLPRIIDTYQVYLRELRPQDMAGSSGLYRLREELLLRVRQAVPGATVKDVLFKELLVQ